MASFVLLHPPLLGPAVWGPCAAVLAAGGHRVAVPDLRAAMNPPERWWDRATGLAAAAGGGAPPVVVAHSGAGVLLPLVAVRLAAAAAVFVDAVVPPDGSAPPSAGLRDFLAGLPVQDGYLPPWSTWWGPEEMAHLVPDPGLRQVLEADQRPLPAAFYDHAVPVPAGWTPPRVGYLRLSPAYRADEAEAAARGWPVRVLEGRHLDLATRPAEVAAEVRALSGS